MADWTHNYREESIPPQGSTGGTITSHTPGRKIAKAVTEIQERAVTDLNLDLEGITDNGSDIENNTLNLRLEAEPGGVTQVQTSLDGIEDTGTNIVDNTLTIALRAEPTEGTTQTIFAVAGGTWPELTVQSLEVENGLIKSVGDGQELYPDKELFTGEVITSATLSYSNDKLTLTLTKKAVDAGLVVSGSETTEELEVTITIPDPLPPGGTQYQVLQRDEAGDAVWDYVRAVEVT